jgi:hypothetical protein
MKKLYVGVVGHRFIAAAIALLLVFLLTAIPFGTTAFVASATAVTDEKDDRPDDADSDAPTDRPDDNDSAGGDNSTATTEISDEARAWANANDFDLTAFENYTVPAAHEPTSADVSAFENWMSGGSNPRNQVMKQIQSAAGESVASELWGYCNTIWKTWMNAANVGSVVSKASGLKNVGAMQEGMFAGYFGSLIGGSNSTDGYGQDGYENAALLIKDGFVVSSDGATYRLHNMIDGTVAYEIAAPESATVSEDEFPEGLTSFTDFFPLETQEATAEAIALLKEYALAGNFSEPSDIDRTVYQAAAAYVNNEFGEYFGQCPGPTVVKGIKALGIELDSITEDSVGSSVGEKEFVASFFGAENAAASLWRHGFLPSFDGTAYRLHSGKDGTVVYEATAEELQGLTADTDTIESSTATPVIPIIIIAVVVVGAVATAFVVKRKKRS